MDIREQEFTVPLGRHRIKGDVVSAGEDAARLVLLHGGGQGTRDRYRCLRTCLARRSIGSLAFDFVGFGETGGDIGESSLQHRTEQACAVIEAMDIQAPFSVLGASMGGYMAVKLSEILAVESIVLFVPAMYDAAAYAVPFGSAFTQIIRRPGSWANSDAWDVLRAFRGRLLLVAAEHDDVIPQDVIRRIDDAAANASPREHYVVPHGRHLLVHYLSQHPHECEHVVGLIHRHVNGESVGHTGDDGTAAKDRVQRPLCRSCAPP